MPEDIDYREKSGMPKQVIIFRSHLRSDVDLAELEAAGVRMYEIVSAMPGFLSSRIYGGESGESVNIVEFESEETLLAWRDHPEHQEIQERGRQKFFTEYHMDVCDSQRAYRFSTTEGRVEGSSN